MNQYNEVVLNFLNKLSVIDYKYRLLEKDKEEFNIFSALHKENDEVRLHSRFLSVLLSPESKHNKKDMFLKLFLKTLSIDNFETENIKVYPTEFNKSEFNEIDILIINRISKQAIIIENKIGAGDSNHEDRGQLEGYYELIHELESIPKERIYVYYLTVDGHLPTSESLGKYDSLENMNGKTIDYEHEIQNWLTLCLHECITQPFLRESIIQYINLIKQMTNDNTNIQERIEIRNLISSSDETMSSTRLLIENFKHIKWHTTSDFWNELCSELEKVGFTISSKPTEANITSTTHYEVYKSSYKTSNDYGIKFYNSSNIQFFIWNGTGDDWLYWGFDKKSLSPEHNLNLTTYLNQNPGFFNFFEQENYSKYFNLVDDENIYFPNFTLKGTFDLIRENHRNMMISNKLVPEIIEFLRFII
ncbi:PD-(D/E)XK nuclease family protein [Fluviicola taffensis]|uniref:Uncharacterized protein n=1 Tax=Fluviicola taffensis (strain DSM 16823 / NCIMB 13979 / RW262) TaxID=755732 RepID=F2I961_FLUTR|nr:PD-(D/E)XK nuclease family protein [Fluviicola taffensis]AEA43008.1 hypothetical protein Fluta_1009 [Fluviicola taffensis DSM 16823]